MISKESLKFLDDLKKNNNRDWFLANKSRYESYKKEYYQLVQDFLDEIKPNDHMLDHLEVKNCVFRVNRDIRFSNDKTPYKTHMGIWMSAGSKNTNLSGYYIHIENGASFIAAGLYWPDAPDLKKVRKEIAFFYDELEDIVDDKNFKSVFGALDRDNVLKTSPKDFEKDHPAIEFLKLKSFTASAKIDDKTLTDKDFVKKTAAKLIALKPLNEFLNRALTSDES
ncbi:TIGR02453 family protein [Flavobacterium noncentrifugens]|uniref:TIGR02453 family protein n=1 Tax=Flavobacterium noncentrifugens TaxID=1128970 RepID=A0A1G8VID5_9FLAO|nr:DUF2461 domain-containing protein [Flavobacterium noncentrifugens]GEP50487.1 TIGR02453 family protein [Flavobacterium noncentrifugens]SDJ64920.1 TIGR02453 family protein [Flavobacterium noncentrifugens]